jgi:hypothetical protein
MRNQMLYIGVMRNQEFILLSFYAVIYFRGITPAHVPAVWNIVVPPKKQLFMWLLSHNKLATVDNLNKKGMNKPVHSISRSFTP